MIAIDVLSAPEAASATPPESVQSTRCLDVSVNE